MDKGWKAFASLYTALKKWQNRFEHIFLQDPNVFWILDAYIAVVDDW